MRSRLTLCALTALSLAACSQKAAETDGRTSAAEDVQLLAKADAGAAPATDARAEPAAEAALTRAEPIQTRRPEPPRDTALAPLGVSIPQLAYSYKYAIAAPPKAVRKLVSKHEAVCWAAGPTVCQVVGSNISEDGEDRVSATLQLRAQPAWLRTFRSGLEDDTKAVGGRTVTADTTSDDLSRSIVDTEASLRSQVILRDRLEAALRTRAAKVSELFEMEAQLAQVRGSIDATRSELAMMKGRVATSTLTIRYQSEGVLAPSGTFAPISEATGDVAGIIVGVMAFLIRVTALLGPIAGLGYLGWLLARRRKPAAKTPAPMS